jgi:hypothetical protein
MARHAAFNSFCLCMALFLVFPSLVFAQSGGASLRGWVAFENVAYVDVQPQATVELLHDPPESNIVYVTKTDEHGFFEFPHTSLGRFTLRITAPKFRPYAAEVYIASDFAGNWAVQLRALEAPSKSR